VVKVRDIFLASEYPVTVPDQKIAYWPVPKNACTSLKYAFYRLRTGKDFVPLRVKNHYLYHIHSVFPSKPFKKPDGVEGYKKLAIVRNPVERIVSAYCNRILYHNDLARHKAVLNRQGFSHQPDFTNFIKNIEIYRKVSQKIKDHTDPQVNYLGNNASFFDYVSNIKGISNLPNILQCQNLDIPRKQDGGGEYKKQVLNSMDKSIEEKIREMHYCDYEVFGDFF
jgi:Sulfotransferase family